MLFPYKQGYLDGLCGLYSAVNAISSILELEHEDCRKLFTIGLDHIDSHTNLKKVILDGMSIKMVTGVLSSYKPQIRDWGWKLTISHFATDCYRITDLANHMRRWLTEENQCIIVGLSGRIDHWTCIFKTFNKIIKFIDSADLKQIHIQKITTGKGTREKIYTVSKDEVLGLRLEQLNSEAG